MEKYITHLTAETFSTRIKNHILTCTKIKQETKNQKR